MRQAWFYASTDPLNYDSSNYLLLPSDCNVVWVTGCGGGGGGATGSTAPGASGGVSAAASPAFVRFPLAVKPNGILTVYVGRGCQGGGQGTSVAGLGQTEQGQQYQVNSRIGGDLVGPEVWPTVPIFELGCGSNTSGPNINVKGGSSGSNSLSTFVGYTWLKTVGNTPFWCMGPSASGENNTAVFANDSALARTVGGTIIDSNQFGAAGTFGEHAGSMAIGAYEIGTIGFASGLAVGAGNSGGASIFGLSGDGGSASSYGVGGNASGYGAGGGSAMGWSGPGGNGADGFILIEY